MQTGMWQRGIMDDQAHIEMPVKKYADMSLSRRIISIAVLTLMFGLTVWFMLDMVLLTFILTFIFYYLLKLERRWINRTPLRKIPDVALLIFIYLFGILILTLCGMAFMPVIISQTYDIARAFINFDVTKLFAQIREAVDPAIASYIMDLDLNQYIDRVGFMLIDLVTNIGKYSLNVLLAIALSFLLLLEKSKIARFGAVMSKSRIAFIYDYFMAFGTNFCRTFAKVMKVQVLIALINAAVSSILLSILQFPNILGLSVMIFVLGLIPVAGVIVSLIPLSIIAFNIGGIFKVVEVLIMVILIHVIEAYILNPKLMSTRTSLPISFVFIILLVAERYLGVWGLLIGVPLFIFLLNIFEVDYEAATRNEKPNRRKAKSDAKVAAKAAKAAAAASLEKDPPQ
jgi:predicted PurR-regulated permease PerM